MSAAVPPPDFVPFVCVCGKRANYPNQAKRHENCTSGVPEKVVSACTAGPRCCFRGDGVHKNTLLLNEKGYHYREARGDITFLACRQFPCDKCREWTIPNANGPDTTVLPFDGSGCYHPGCAPKK